MGSAPLARKNRGLTKKNQNNARMNINLRHEDYVVYEIPEEPREPEFPEMHFHAALPLASNRELQQYKERHE